MKRSRSKTLTVSTWGAMCSAALKGLLVISQLLVDTRESPVSRSMRLERASWKLG